MAMENLTFIKRFLAEHPESAYLSLDYENKNPLLASFTSGLMLTRKVAFLFKSERPIVIAQTLDCPFLKKGYVGANIEIVEYRDWKEYLALLKKYLSDTSAVYMDVSENGLLPRVSLADYGSVAYVMSLGKEIRSSADLLNEMIGTLSPEGEASQKVAADLLLAIKDEAFAYMAQALKAGKTILLEGQLGTMKDTDHGIYPMVTSSSTLAGYGAVGAGVPPYEIKQIIRSTATSHGWPTPEGKSPSRWRSPLPLWFGASMRPSPS